MRIWWRLSSIMWCLLCVCVPGIQNYPILRFFLLVQSLSVYLHNHFHKFCKLKKAEFLHQQWLVMTQITGLEDRFIVFILLSRCTVVYNCFMKLNSCSLVSSCMIANQLSIMVFKCCAPLHTAFRFSSSTEQSSSRLMRRHRRRRRKPKASNMDRVRGHDVDETRDWKSASHIPSLII